MKLNFKGLTYISVCFGFSLPQILNAQTAKDSLSKDIEVVKITRQFLNNKKNLETNNSDLINHDAGKFLEVLPEFSGIKKAGNYATDPVLRGFKYEQLNIIIDGVASAINACPSRMDPATSQVPMNIVKEAEIYKGPYHFRQGASFGGTINFVTIQPTFTDSLSLKGRLTTGYESNGNVLRDELFTSLSSKKIVWDLYGSYQKGDDYKDGNGNKVPSSFLRYNLGTKASYRWNENNVTTFHLNTNQARNVEFAALSMDLLYDKTWMLQARHTVKIDNSIVKNLDFNSYASFVKHSMGTPDKSMISNVGTNTYGERGEAKLAWGNNVFYSGLDFKHEEAKNISSKMSMMMMGGMMMPMIQDGTSWQNSYDNQIGWFNEFNHDFGNGKLTASYRLDYNQADAKDLSKLFQTLYGTANTNQINNSLSLAYSQELNAKNKLSLLIGRAQRSGSLTERFINRYPGGIDAYELVGNPNLKAETNNQTDLIYTFKTEKLFFQADVFYSYLQNSISGKIIPLKPLNMMSPGTRQLQNLGDAYKTGFESRINWNFLPKLTSEMAIAYTYAEEISTKNPLPEIAPLDLRWKIQYDIAPFVFAAKYRFVNTQNRINPEFGEFKTPDFSLMDVSAKMDIFKNAQINFEVNNVFNRAYAEYLNRTLSLDKMQRILNPGRNFVVNFSYQF
ncbi:TonB-dependent receptor domain-containing protein [Halpernia frigidisoli]|uniref:Iron complex outermembrane recepter protein n=1 Tax=Halpernia frigidisoli TaxID=1125876 RepID=A0A1I3HSA4_9FLAO|nr:TonB-dependent receptor [Halpernia frigidisoli]SFI38634.1 iron complex outermembrane recepter protein [Halpernia frigidisoli]